MRTLKINLFLLIIIFGMLSMNSCKQQVINQDSNMVLLPVKDDPTVSFKIWFKAGSQNDLKGKEGIAAMTAMLLTEGGTKKLSYEQILDKLYPMAAYYSADVDKEMTVISGRCHKDNLKDYSEMLVDAICNPAFNESDFERVKSQVFNSIENELRYSNDEELGKAVLYGSIFEGTSYGHLTDGTVQSIKSMTINDIHEFYKKFFTMDNMVIGLGGGYDDKFADDFKKQLEQLPVGKVEEVQKPKPAAIDGLNFTIIDKDCEATAISFGFPTDVLRGGDDFFALALFASWFGEHRNSSSHLYQVIRERRGMNYGDYAYIETFLNGGSHEVPEPNNPRRQQIFEVWLRPVQHVHAHFALRAAMRELKNVVDNGMTKEDFEITQKFLNKYALHYAPTTSMRLGYAIDSKFYGIQSQGDYIDLFRKKINALTLDEVNKAIKKHLQYNNIKFAVVTKNAEKFKEMLVKNELSPIQYSTPKPDNILQEDKLIEYFPLKILPDKVKIISVESIFEK